MHKKIDLTDKIFVAGSKGMVGNAICKALLSDGYGRKENGGSLLAPDRKTLNLLNVKEVEQWFLKNRPSVVILAAAKVGGILANQSFPADFLINN